MPNIFTEQKYLALCGIPLQGVVESQSPQNIFCKNCDDTVCGRIFLFQTKNEMKTLEQQRSSIVQPCNQETHKYVLHGVINLLQQYGITFLELQSIPHRHIIIIAATAFLDLYITLERRYLLITGHFLDKIYLCCPFSGNQFHCLFFFAPQTVLFI